MRWVAVRHAADHIHIVATRVRQDRRTAWTAYDYRKAQAACRDLEERYGLHRVGPPGTGPRRWPHASELNKAARLNTKAAAEPGRTVAPRDVLRRKVRAVAAVATDDADFLARLKHAGVLVKVRHSSRNPGQVTGYAVGLDGHTTATGDTIWYGGGRLAADLTLPRLRTRWTGPEQPSGSSAARLAATGGFAPPGVYQRAADTSRQAAAAMRETTNPGTASAIAYAAADVLTAMAQAWEGRRGGPLTDAAGLFDRAAHDLRDRTPAHRVSAAVQLRVMARLIAVMGAISRDEDTAAAVHMLYTVAALAESLADLREAQHRLHQAQAARTAAEQLRSYAPPSCAPTAAPAGVWGARRQRFPDRRPSPPGRGR